MIRDDCISRDMLLEKMADYVSSGYADSVEDYVEYLNIICQLPIVQPKTEWIPVSERLPEKNVWVLVTVEQSGHRYQEIMRRNNYIEAWSDGIDNYTDIITAWCPLPEPYKESEG